jgi:hypothetical protein
MSFEKYDLFFSGQVIDGLDKAEVRTQVGKIFRATEAQLDRLFSGDPVPIKKAVDMDTAIKYRVTLREAGALIDVVPAQSPGPPSAEQEKSSVPPPASGAAVAPSTGDGLQMTLAPPRTGSLEDCAPETPPAEVPDISDLHLAPESEPLAPQRAISAPNIDTSELQLYPANTGDLRDCQTEPTPLPLPDISDLKLLDPDKDS